MKDFNRMSVGVLEVEGFDAPRVLVPVGQPLRARGGVLDIVLSQNRVRSIHVADNDGEVLKPKVVAARIDGNGAATRSKKLHELDRFVAEAHSHDAGARTEKAKEMLQVV